MQVHALGLEGVKLIELTVSYDERGFFCEVYHQSRFAAAGITDTFVQDNHSGSRRGTLRGLHFQSRPGQAKLVRVVVGRIYDVVVDIRLDAPTCGRWLGLELDSTSGQMLYLPVGYAHGFCVLSDWAEVIYKVSSPYDPDTECALRWDDPELGIRWPVEQPLLSERDRSALSFAEYRLRAGR